MNTKRNSARRTGRATTELGRATSRSIVVVRDELALALDLLEALTTVAGHVEPSGPVDGLATAITAAVRRADAAAAAANAVEVAS